MGSEMCIRDSLKSARIDPAPRRDGPGWAEFLRSQAQGIVALDFFTANLLNGAKVCVLAVIEHGSRRDKPSTDTARDTIRKISFKPTGRRSSHLRTDPDLPARHPNAGPSQPRSAKHLPRCRRFSAPTGSPITYDRPNRPGGIRSLGRPRRGNG